MDPTEAAKAAAALAQFGTTGLGTTEKILKFTAKVFQSPIAETSGIIGDRLKFYRWKRQIALVDKADTILTKKGIKVTRAVPPKLALPILENASLEDDDDLQELWAKLLVNSMDPKFTEEIRITFVDIIKTLTPTDVNILDVFYKSAKNDPKIDWANIARHNVNKEEICQVLGISSEVYEISAYNLFRNQCLTPAILTGGMNVGNEPITIYKGTKSVALTDLGVKFIEACIQ